MNVKGLILCAGIGSRLRPLTFSSAKHLIPVANKPIVFYIIEWLRDAGITEIGIVVGVNRLELMNSVGNGERWGVEIAYIDQTNPLGTAHAVQVAETFIGDSPFVMILGDNLFQHGLNDFVQKYRDSRPDSMIMLHQTDRPGDFGIAEVEDGAVIGLEEKPDNPKSNLAVAGVYVFSPSIFDAISRIHPSPRGELELPDAVRLNIEEGLRVESYLLEGWWKDTGRPEDVIDLNHLLLADLKSAETKGSVDAQSELIGLVSLAEGSVIERSRIVGPVIIGPGAFVQDSYIGPYTSIGAECRIIGSEIEFGVVMDETVIEGIAERIGCSLIGKQAHISRATNRPQQNVFVVGDRSEVRIMAASNGH